MTGSGVRLEGGRFGYGQSDLTLSPPLGQVCAGRPAEVTEQCVLYSALDVYVRHLDVTVPSDAVAHIDADLGKAALRMRESNVRATVVPAADCLG